MLGTMLSAYTCGHMSSSQALCAAGTAPRPIFTAEETEAQNADVVSSQTTLSLPVGALVKWRVVPTAGPPPPTRSVSLPQETMETWLRVHPRLADSRALGSRAPGGLGGLPSLRSTDPEKTGRGEELAPALAGGG